MAFQNLEIVHVVAMDENRCIGKNNELPWHLPEDLKHFKALTEGGIIIMGRKTLESMGRILPNRTHWVITRDPNWSFKGATIAHTLEAALIGAAEEAFKTHQKSLFVIGGGEVFAQTLDFADRLELTHIHVNVQGDTFYPILPQKFSKTHSTLHQSTQSNITFEFATYTSSPI